MADVIEIQFLIPQIFHSKYALARPKNAHMPLNFKADISNVFNKVSEICDLISSKIEEGRRVHVSKNEDAETGFFLNID